MIGLDRNRHLIIAVCLLIATEIVWVAETCNEKALDDCFSNLRQSTHFKQMHNNDTIFPTWNDTQLELLCRSMTEAENCAINVTVHCNSAEFQLYKGSDKAISYLCTEGRQQYRNVRNCFKKNAVRQSKSRCHGDYLEALDNLHGSTERSHDEKVLEICRTIDQSIVCVGQSIARECGEDAATWTSAALTHQHRPTKDELRCHVLETQIRSLSPPVVFGVILLLLLTTTVVIMTSLLVYRRFVQRPNHHRLPGPHLGLVKYNNATPLKGRGGGGGADGGRATSESLAGAGEAEGRSFDHLDIPLMLSQSGVSATGRTAFSNDDNNTPSTVR